MKSLVSYLIIIFIIFFWIFRIAVALTATLKVDFMIKPIDLTYEVLLLFITLVAIVLIIKRNIIGGLIYFISYLLYFGSTTINLVIQIVNGEIGSTEYMNVFLSVAAIVLAISALIDVSFNKDRTNKGLNKKTDWFYNNEQFDRKLDDRADKNNYRTM